MRWPGLLSCAERYQQKTSPWLSVSPTVSRELGQADRHGPLCDCRASGAEMQQKPGSRSQPGLFSKHPHPTPPHPQACSIWPWPVDGGRAIWLWAFQSPRAPHLDLRCHFKQSCSHCHVYKRKALICNYKH